MWHFDIGPVVSVNDRMRVNPLSLAEREGNGDFVFQRIQVACQTSNFIETFWTWYPLSVHLSLFLTVRERTILSISCAVLLLDFPEVSFGVTEVREGIRVLDWEVPTPPLQTSSSEAWDLAEDVTNDE